MLFGKKSQVDKEEIKDFSNFKDFLGGSLDLDKATEPSDIIWENRGFT